MNSIICVCRARGVIRSNRLRSTVGTTSPAAESDCFIRAAIFGPSISAGIAAVHASCRSRPSDESPRSCCNSTGLGWLKPANFGTPNFDDDGCRMGTLARPTSGANTVGQECPTYCSGSSTACGSTASTFPTCNWETSASENHRALRDGTASTDARVRFRMNLKFLKREDIVAGALGRVFVGCDHTAITQGARMG